MFSFFFFQAEDGIRDPLVTGVQTCALPIWPAGQGGQLPGGSVPGLCDRAGLGAAGSASVSAARLGPGQEAPQEMSRSQGGGVSGELADCVGSAGSLRKGSAVAL